LIAVQRGYPLAWLVGGTVALLLALPILAIRSQDCKQPSERNSP